MKSKKEIEIIEKMNTIEMVQQEIKKEGMETIQQEYIPQFYNCCMGCRKVLDNPRKYCIFCISKRVKEREMKIEQLKNEIRKEREINKQSEKLISEKLKEIHKPTDFIAETQRLYYQTEQHERTIKLLEVKEKDMLRECIEKMKSIHNELSTMKINVNQLIDTINQYQQLYSERSGLIQLQAFLKDQILFKQKQQMKMTNDYLLISTITQTTSSSSSNSNSSNSLNSSSLKINTNSLSQSSKTSTQSSSTETSLETTPRYQRSRENSLSSSFSSSTDQFFSSSINSLQSLNSTKGNERIVYRIINLVINCENNKFNSLSTANIFIQHIYRILKQYHQILYIPFNLHFEMKKLDEPSYLTRKNISFQSIQQSRIIISSSSLTFNDQIFKLFLDIFLFLYHTLFKTNIQIDGINYVDSICKILQYFISL